MFDLAKKDKPRTQEFLEAELMRSVQDLNACDTFHLALDGMFSKLLNSIKDLDPKALADHPASSDIKHVYGYITQMQVLTRAVVSQRGSNLDSAANAPGNAKRED